MRLKNCDYFLQDRVQVTKHCDYYLQEGRKESK